MSAINYPRLLIFFAFLISVPLAANAQDAGSPAAREAKDEQPEGRRRPDLFRELGLTSEQIQNVRKLNAERKPVEQEARRRFQEANRELNIAIYADSISDAVFQTKLKEFQAAQAELARIKFANELAVRRLLTPEQLGKFRALRERFAEARKDIEGRAGAPNRVPPFRRLKRSNRLPQ